jgi:hypothetical protein
MLTDTNGFAIPFADDDAVIECGACDPHFGDPSTWPEWVDADRWEPAPDDVAWLNQEPYEPTDADWEEFARYSGHFTDEDLIAAGLPCG